MAWLRGEDARRAFDADVARLAVDAGTRFARGNIALQHGAVQTVEESERERAEARRAVEKAAARR